jgi:hypothetical protein
MELIILLIVLKVLSSLFQSFRGGGGKPLPPPRRPLRPPLPPDFFDIRKEKNPQEPEGGVMDIREGLEDKEETAPGEMAAAKPSLQPLFFEDEIPGDESQPLWQVAARRREVPVSSRKEGQEKVVRHKREYELARLLKGDNLALGIVALEVLSPPRARRPFHSARVKK